jgi:hypothetical protein
MTTEQEAVYRTSLAVIGVLVVLAALCVMVP